MHHKPSSNHCEKQKEGNLNKKIGFTVFFLGCSIGDHREPAPNSPSHQAMENLKAIQKQSAEIEQLALELESWVDEARRKVKAGESQEKQVKIMETLMKKIDNKNQTLQTQIQTFENSLRRTE